MSGTREKRRASLNNPHVNNTKRKREDEVKVPAQKKQNRSQGSQNNPSLTTDVIEKLQKECSFVYRESPLDKTDFMCVKEVNILNIVDRKCYGVYASKQIPSEKILGSYVGKETTEINPDPHYSVVIKEPGEKNPGLYCDAKQEGNLFRFLNHSEKQANVIFRLDENSKQVLIQALRTIQPNEQLLLDYNNNTFTPNTDTKYYFLNGDDTWKSSSEYLDENKDKYQLYHAKKDYPALNIAKDEKLYVTTAGMIILNKEELTDENVQKDMLQLRFLKAAEHSDQTCVEFNTFDTFNALMLACYFGQVKNVEYLIKKGVDVNRQQNTSGQSALFFALQGVKDNQCEKENCVNVIRILISNKADIFIQDNQDQIFLYSVIQLLSTEQAASILNLISKKTFSKISQYVNKSDEDAIYFSIKHKRLDMLPLLLEYYPSYFNKTVNNHANFYNQTDMKKLLENYTGEEIEKLKNILTDNNMSETAINDIFNSVDNENNDDNNDSEKEQLHNIDDINPNEIVTASIVTEQPQETPFHPLPFPAQPHALTMQKIQELQIWKEKYSAEEDILTIYQEGLLKKQSGLIAQIIDISEALRDVDKNIHDLSNHLDRYPDSSADIKMILEARLRWRNNLMHKKLNLEQELESLNETRFKQDLKMKLLKKSQKEIEMKLLGQRSQLIVQTPYSSNNIYNYSHLRTLFGNNNTNTHSPAASYGAAPRQKKY